MNVNYIVIAFLAGTTIGFGSGWQVNGWRMSGVIAALEQGIASAESAALIRQAEVVAEREAELNEIIGRERKIAAEAASQLRKVSNETKRIRREFAEALEDPNCAEWAAVRVACPTWVRSDNGDPIGRSAGGDPVPAVASRVIN
tara:strand:+ start:5672 stop:6103 length:432 start_codon:yes stop_codon:yes gene_type:complete